MQNIPLEFVKKHLKKELDHKLNNKFGMFKLCTVTGKNWSVKCAASGASHVTLSSGWKRFALDNELREGDICIFEMIKGAKNMFRVCILSTVGENPAESYPEVKSEGD